MDAAGLMVLLAELDLDCAIARDAAGKAALRVKDNASGSLEACAYELARLYNIIEKMFERVCEDFENRCEKRGDYHERLLQRLSLRLESIRPAFVPSDRVQELRELEGLRHITRHAYDLVLRRDRLEELAKIAENIASELPGWCAQFGRAVRAEQGWEA